MESIRPHKWQRCLASSRWLSQGAGPLPPGLDNLPAIPGKQLRVTAVISPILGHPNPLNTVKWQRGDSGPDHLRSSPGSASLATWPWTNPLTFLGFSFLRRKVGKIPVLTSEGCKKMNWVIFKTLTAVLLCKHLSIYQINKYLSYLPRTP